MSNGSALISTRIPVTYQLHGARTLCPLLRIAACLVICTLLSACATRHVVAPPEPPVVDTGWKERTVKEEELKKVCQADPSLDLQTCRDILARLNTKDRDYIPEDLKKGKKLKVPNDFRAYKNWTPLPAHLPGGHNGKAILIVKDIPFLGWYEKGKLIDDAQICIGKKAGWTKAGYYKVRVKDENHVSQSYRNAYGYPALMPYALHIYARVWIHAGDVVDGYCSHGCINVPLREAQDLFKWAERGTPVLVLESLKDLNAQAQKHLKTTGRQSPEKPPKVAKTKSRK